MTIAPMLPGRAGLLLAQQETGNGDMILLIVYLVVAIGFSFYCSVAEATLLSISPSYIATLAKRKLDGTSLGRDEDPSLLDPRAVASSERLGRLKDNVDRPLAAILSLNTIAHTIGAAGVGAQAAKIWGSGAVGIASALMTLAILVLSEIIPKTIGALHWRKLAGVIATSINGLIWLLYPLVWMSELMTKMLSGGHSVHGVTQDDFAAMADLGLKHGLLGEKQSQVIYNLMRMKEITVTDIHTPRPVLITMSQDTTVDQLVSEYDVLPVSRVPVHENDIDKITGIILRSDILRAKIRGEGKRPLSDYRREVLTVRDDMDLLTLMHTLLDGNAHLAIVVDQYGGTDGVVTLEDLVETLFGTEIVDESDTVEDLQKRARQAWQKRAQTVGLKNIESADD